MYKHDPLPWASPARCTADHFDGAVGPISSDTFLHPAYGRPAPWRKAAQGGGSLRDEAWGLGPPITASPSFGSSQASWEGGDSSMMKVLHPPRCFPLTQTPPWPCPVPGLLQERPGTASGACSQCPGVRGRAPCSSEGRALPARCAARTGSRHSPPQTGASRATAQPASDPTCEAPPETATDPWAGGAV